MCGFVGYSLCAPQRGPDLLAWGTSIGHRGPDQAGSAHCGHFGLGTRRLSILDLSSLGDQPMEASRYLLGFNGEIYNHQELRAELRRSGYTFRSGSDTETVLLGCEHWGVRGTLERLNGMFALAVWDKVADELTLARDPLGIKPLYFLPRDEGLYFASELKALRPYCNGEVSAEGTALYLFFGFVPAPYSLIRGVHKVRPGEAVVYSKGRLTSYRTVPQSWQQAPGEPRTNVRVGDFRSAVAAAIERQLLCDVPLGVFLSGGVDSSVIAAVAANAQPGLASFSIRPELTGADPGASQDAEIAARFAKRLGLEHHEVSISPSDFAEASTQLPLLLDEPPSEPYALAEVLLSRAARAAGVPVVLTGHGADELFIGYPGYAAAQRGAFYNRLPWLGPMAQNASQIPLLSARQAANLKGLARVWRQPPFERYATISAVHFSFEHTRSFGLADRFVMELVHEVISQTDTILGELPRAGAISPLEQFARLDLRLKVPEHYNARLDKATMSASVEARVPFQDLELVAFVAGLSDRTLLQGGLKGLLKTSFKEELPKEVVCRTKQTFQAPVLSWLQGPLADWARLKLAQLPGAPTSLQDPSRYTTSQQAYSAWSLGALETWREAYGLSYR